jgi:hypothetical protein
LERADFASEFLTLISASGNTGFIKASFSVRLPLRLSYFGIDGKRGQAAKALKCETP